MLEIPPPEVAIVRVQQAQHTRIVRALPGFKHVVDTCLQPLPRTVVRALTN